MRAGTSTVRRSAALALASLIFVLEPRAALAAATAPATPQSVSVRTPATTLPTLIDRYVAWRGGAAYDRLKSVHRTALIEAGGLKGKVENWEAGDRSRTELDLAGMKRIQVVTPERSWTTTPSGQVQYGQGARTGGHESQLQSPQILRGGGGATAVLAGSEQRDGQTWSVVRVGFGDKDVYDVFLDPLTGALGGYRITENGLQGTEILGDWRRIGGVPFAFLQTNQSEAAGAVTVRQISVEINRPVDGAMFEPPPDVRKAVFAGAAASTDWLDFEFFEGGQIYLPIKLNGHDTVALLDNGASSSFIDQAYAASLGLVPQGVFPVQSATGVGTSGLIGGVDIQTGGLTLKNLTVQAMDLGPMARFGGHPLPVILGDEIFNELIVDLDFANHRVAFRDPSQFTPPPGAVVLPLIRNGASRLTPVAVEGREPAQFDVDLGAAGVVDIAPAYVVEQRLLEDRVVSDLNGWGIGGVRRGLLTTLRQVDFAGVRFTGAPAAFPQTWPGAAYSSQVQGVLGIGILSRFRLIIDYPHDRLYAVAYPNAATAPFDRPFPKDRLGLQTVRQGADYAVTAVAPGSPADRAGFRIGDLVVSINGRPLSGMPAESWGALGAGPAGAQVEFAVKGGAVRTATLADYY
jgi:hypothetical protein